MRYYCGAARRCGEVLEILFCIVYVFCAVAVMMVILPFAKFCSLCASFARQIQGGPDASHGGPASADEVRGTFHTVIAYTVIVVFVFIPIAVITAVWVSDCVFWLSDITCGAICSKCGRKKQYVYHRRPLFL